MACRAYTLNAYSSRAGGPARSWAGKRHPPERLLQPESKLQRVSDAAEVAPVGAVGGRHRTTHHRCLELGDQAGARPVHLAPARGRRDQHGPRTHSRASAVPAAICWCRVRTLSAASKDSSKRASHSMPRVMSAKNHRSSSWLNQEIGRAHV